MNLNYSDAFQNPAPLANEYPNQAVHKFVVWFYHTFGPGGTAPLSGGGGLAIPGGSTGFTVTYYGSTNNIQTVTYSNGSVLTLTYVGGGAADDDLILTATVS